VQTLAHRQTRTTSIPTSGRNKPRRPVVAHPLFDVAKTDNSLWFLFLPSLGMPPPLHQTNLTVFEGCKSWAICFFFCVSILIWTHSEDHLLPAFQCSNSTCFTTAAVDGTTCDQQTSVLRYSKVGLSSWAKWTEHLVILINGRPNDSCS